LPEIFGWAKPTHPRGVYLSILQVVRLMDRFHGEWLTVGTLIRWLEATWDGRERAQRSVRLAEGRARVRQCRVLMEAFEAWHVSRLQTMADEVIKLASLPPRARPPFSSPWSITGGSNRDHVRFV
jgi:hypothetical protein